MRLLKHLPLFLYVFAFGFAGHSWFSEVLSLQAKLIVTLVSVGIFGLGFFVQWKWDTSEE
jgi:hypothetical protein